MLENMPPIRPMSEREYRFIPIDQIAVPNPRNRCEKQFQENLRSIQEVGLQNPPTVNKRYFKETGKYDLVCGQGRWEIHKKLNETEILVEVIDVDKGEAFILSLVENIARARPASIEFARVIVSMFDAGMNYDELSKITGHDRHFLGDYIILMKKGEERLIAGVEAGVFPITFAKDVAKSSDADIQRLLMDAFEEGLVSSKNLKVVRKILESRKKTPNVAQFKDIDELKQSIQDMTEKKRIECNQAKKKESRLYRLLIALKDFSNSKEFLDLLKEHGISPTLNLKGKYDI